MKLSDYIVEFLIEKGITDIFGYPGGMVTHFIDSLSKYQDKIKTHINYHEQAAAFAACAYANTSGNVGVAFATSGPGATNLITGICNAYFDSIPTIFITGQVNTNERNIEGYSRQNGFQETNITEMVKNVTKFSYYLDNKNDIKYILQKAYYIAKSGRPGPVLLDIPMNVFNSMINVNELNAYQEDIIEEEFDCSIITDNLSKYKRPCIIIGNGVKNNNCKELINKLVNNLKIPVVSSMLAVDIINNDELNFGFIGAYGNRVANFIVAKSDLIICIGTRLDIRQIGAKKENFAPNAKIIRIDIDENELKRKVKPDEIGIKCSVNFALKKLNNMTLKYDFSEWLKVCNEIKKMLANVDENKINNIINKISEIIPNDTIITTDVGQNQVWISQSFKFKSNQLLLTSGGLGAMGYSLPAAIGAYYGAKKPVVCFAGDGGFQMNIQELQYLNYHKIPITIIVFNNNSLGMIRHFQEMYFSDNYAYTTEESGYSCVNLEQISKAYNLKYEKITLESQITSKIYEPNKLIEISLSQKTYVYPKLEFGKPNQDQEPLIDRDLYNKIMEL